MESILRDVRYGVRTLLKDPTFTAVAVLMLALGIGANTAIFSVVNVLLLRPLPFPRSDRLTFVTEHYKQIPSMSFSLADFQDLGRQNTVFSSLFGFRSGSYILTGTGMPQRLAGRQISAGFTPTLGIHPLLGRSLTETDDRPGAERVVLLGETLWKRRFGGDPNIVGKIIRLNDEPFTVIGIMPSFPKGLWQNVEVWTSLGRLEGQIGGPQRRGQHPGIYVIGRLNPGVTVQQALSQVAALGRRLAETYPDTNSELGMTLKSLQDNVVGSQRQPLLVLLGAVFFVLLIACANVANLLLARAATQQPEFAVRSALGAGRTRLVRQMITESVLLSLLGGIAAVGIAYAGMRGLVSLLSADGIPLVDQIQLNGTVLLFTAGISLLTGLIFGLAPAWQMSRTELHDTLREGGRGGSSARGRQRLRRILVVAEVSLALFLLLGAGLMLKSFFQVLNANPGFDAKGVLTASISLPETTYNKDDKVIAFIEQTLNKARNIPGAQVVGSTLPLLGHWQTQFLVEGRPVPPSGQGLSTDIARVSTDYFKAMGVPLVKGRTFEPSDRRDSKPVCIVDETFADANWPDQNPVGKRIRENDPDEAKFPWLTVVGVVGHVKNYGVDQPSRVEAYLPFRQNTVSAFSVVIRTKGDPTALTSALREAVLSVDPDVPIFNVSTLQDQLASNAAPRRLAVSLIGVFAGLALLLAAVGLYGVISYRVTQNTHEIGIRMALGANRRNILQLVVRQGMLLTATGLVIGLLGALLLPDLIGALLFQTSPADPEILAGVPLLLAAVALAACYLPARRATRVDPIIALRYE